MSEIQDKIVEERDHAREVCSTEGATSGACAAAWDAVEELQAEASHKRENAGAEEKSSLEKYCDDNPEAAECRIYDD